MLYNAIESLVAFLLIGGEGGLFSWRWRPTWSPRQGQWPRWVVLEYYKMQIWKILCVIPTLGNVYFKTDLPRKLLEVMLKPKIRIESTAVNQTSQMLKRGHKDCDQEIILKQKSLMCRTFKLVLHKPWSIGIH